MKLHPAIKAAKRLFKQHGMECYYAGTLSMQVSCREYNDRPLIVDLVLSQREEKAKIDVCWLSEGHTMYAQARMLHGVEFAYGD